MGNPDLMAALMPYLLVLGVAAIFGLPFLLFTTGMRFTGRRMLTFWSRCSGSSSR